MPAVIVPYHRDFLNQIKDIFFESSVRTDFKSEEEKDAFFFKYSGHYLHHFPDLAFVAVGEKVLGYVLGAPTSSDEGLKRIQPHLAVFERYFEAYPAHLHINCHRDARGQGIGSMLVKRFESCLQERLVSGLHIMTGPDAANREFYKRLGFHDEAVEEFKGGRILLMGKVLSRR
jgi:GNAT superfamily N-acetyltransferase